MAGMGSNDQEESASISDFEQAAEAVHFFRVAVIASGRDCLRSTLKLTNVSPRTIARSMTRSGMDSDWFESRST